MSDTKKTVDAEKTVTIVPSVPPLPRRKRVAAYARVSVEKDTMLHSLAAQVSYYSGLIQKHAGWEYAGVFADEGLTGTKENRPEFQRLLSECRAGRIDMILVKSISRFTRNTVTLLSTVRELKALGVDVVFEEQNIHTLSGDGELMLSVLASFAQAESESVSENCKWRIRKKFQQGIVTGMTMYGYTIKNSVFTIIPEEAAVVREIFDLYISGYGREKIARLLNERGVPSPHGLLWHPNVVKEILRNEKYTGRLLLQKRFTEDCLTKKQKKNHGERPQFFVEDDHEEIIDGATFDAVQAELARRGRRNKKATEGDTEIAVMASPAEKRENLFTGKVICGICGKHFKKRTANSGTPYAKPVWICNTMDSQGKICCASRRICEKLLSAAVADTLNIPAEKLPGAINRVERIVVFPDGRLQITVDGKTVERLWSNPSRSESWTLEMKRKAAADALKRNSHAGMKKEGLPK